MEASKFAFNLSFELGQPINVIEQMLLRDFLGYWEFSLTNMMPNQRTAFYLAQIAYVTAVSMTGYKGSINDFMLDKSHSRSIKSDPKDNPIFKNFNPVKKPKG